jgi:HEAT repeat protein
MRSVLGVLFGAGLLAAGGCAPKMTMTRPELRMLARRYVTAAVTFPDNPVIRAQAIETLLEADGADATHWFREALQDKHPGVRFAALMALGEVRCNAAANDIQKHLQDPDPNVRLAAMFALRRLGDPRFIQEWGDIVRDAEDVNLRRNAVMALGRLGEKEALPLLRRASEDDDTSVQLQALEAMGLLGDLHGVKQLIFYANGGYGDRQAFALIALGRIGDVHALETLRYNLHEASHIECKLAAARALGMMGHPDGYELAIDALDWHDPDRQRPDDPPANQIMRVHGMAIHALGDIGNPDALERLYLRMRDEPDPRVQLAAAAAILRILHRVDQNEAPSAIAASGT